MLNTAGGEAYAETAGELAPVFLFIHQHAFHFEDFPVTK